MQINEMGNDDFTLNILFSKALLNELKATQIPVPC
jgi:hypothetical protein